MATHLLAFTVGLLSTWITYVATKHRERALTDRLWDVTLSAREYRRIREWAPLGSPLEQAIYAELEEDLDTLNDWMHQ